ncbi:MAG: hypothetical protein JKY46_06180 [Robiginitomaculum sp.]|nr:hypothetical protein [Robiginitomaculum sp.]
MKSTFEQIKQEMGKGPLVPIMLSVVFLGIPLLILLASYNKDGAEKALQTSGIILAILLAAGSLPFLGIYFHNLGKRWPEPVRKNKFREKLRRIESFRSALIFILVFWVLVSVVLSFENGVEAFISKTLTVGNIFIGLFWSSMLLFSSRMFIERWAWHLSVWKNKKFHRIGVRFRRRFKIKRRRKIRPTNGIETFKGFNFVFIYVYFLFLISLVLESVQLKIIGFFVVSFLIALSFVVDMLWGRKR